MRTFAVLLPLALLSLSKASVVKDCGGSKAVVDLSQVDINACHGRVDRCTLVKNRDVTIKLPFTPTEDIQHLKARASGVLSPLNVGVPFNLREKSNACVNSGIPCPLQPNTHYTYTLKLPILSIYPTIDVGVKLELEDSTGAKVVCVEFPATIVNS